MVTSEGRPKDPRRPSMTSRSFVKKAGDLALSFRDGRLKRIEDSIPILPSSLWPLQTLVSATLPLGSGRPHVPPPPTPSMTCVSAHGQWVKTGVFGTMCCPTPNATESWSTNTWSTAPMPRCFPVFSNTELQAKRRRHTCHLPLPQHH